MNTFIPETPKVLVLIDPVTGERQATANNISPDLFVNLTDNPTYFDEVSKGMPFNTIVRE